VLGIGIALIVLTIATLVAAMLRGAPFDKMILASGVTIVGVLYVVLLGGHLVALRTGRAVLGEVGLFLPSQDGMTTGPAVDGAYEYYLTARNSLRLGVGWANPKVDREHSDGTRQIRVGGDLIHNWEGGAIHPFVGAGVGSYFLQPIDNGNSFGPSDTRFGARLLGGGGLLPAPIPTAEDREQRESHGHKR